MINMKSGPINNKPPEERELPRGKKGEYLVMLQLILMTGFIVLPVYPQLSGLELFKSLAFIRWTILSLFTGYALLLVALGLFSIRKSLTPLPYPTENNQLVTTGIYHVVRHPLYSGVLFAAFGWSAFQMSLSHLFMTGIGLFFFDYKAAQEERWLSIRHPEYNSYRHRVKKFIPWIY